MAYTSVKITADSSDYRTQIKSAATQMKELSSEYSLAATKAKLFGSAADALKAKSESLTQKINVQKNVVQMNREQQERLTAQLDKQKTKQEELKAKIETAKKAYEDEKKATDEDSDATKALKEELDKLEQEFKENEGAIERAETALSKQTLSTNKAEVSLMEMEKELEDVNKELKNHKLNEFADGCDKAGQKMESFGEKMSVVSAGIAAIGAASVAAFKELDEGYDTIVTKTGATGENFDNLKESADKVFTKMPEDMATIGEAIGEVNTRFHSTGEELEDLSTQFIQFASINGTDVTSSVDQVDKIMRAWNIDTSQTGNLLGLLTQKAQDTGISVDKLESYVLDNNSAFKEMGLSLPQAINLMAQFDENGVDTTTALAGLKKALQNATAEGKSMDVALEETIGSIKDAKTDTEALQIATELFGKKGAAEMAIAIREGRINIDTLSASMSSFGTVVESTYNGTLDPIDQATVAMNNVKLALSELAATAQTAAAPIIESAIEKIQELTQRFTSLDEGQQQTIIKVGLFTAAVGPAAIGIGKFAQGISTTIKTGQQLASDISAIIAKITAKTAATAAGAAAEAAGTAATTAHAAATTAATTTTGAMTVAQGALNTVMSLCPIILIVAAIAGLIAAGVALYKNWDTVKEKLSALWGHVKEKFDAIKEKISNVFSGAKETVSNITNAMKETVRQKLDNIKTAYEENGGGIKGIVAAGWEGIKGYYTAGFSFIDNLSGGKLSGLKNKFSEKLGETKDTVSEKLLAVKDTVKQKWEDIQVSYEEGGGGVSGILEVIFDQQAEVVRGAFDTIQNITGINLENVKEKVVTEIQNVRNSVVNFVYDIQETVINSSIGQEITNVFTNVKETAANLTRETTEAVKQNLSNMKAAYEENGGGIKGIVAAGWEGIKGYYTLGFDFINNLTGGKLEAIRLKFTTTMERVKTAVSSAIEKIKGVFNFSWSLPKIKLPHFKISGEFSLNPPSTPKFGIEWYRTGGIMTSPTAFGMNGNNIMMGGEAGAEAILLLSEFYERLNSILDKKIEAIQKAQNVYVVNHTYIDSDEVASRTVSKVDAEMVSNKRKGR